MSNEGIVKSMKDEILATRQKIEDCLSDIKDMRGMIRTHKGTIRKLERLIGKHFSEASDG